ncbi:hypothetical protein [Microvirga zambiensis]|uniref:hypothetical protein n=1 Tax=Microvirga zambiensis TaxID=1402137 RepID=UPI00191E0C9B|nr:hypothetical protein [Microvirga zambiensis]
MSDDQEAERRKQQELGEDDFLAYLKAKGVSPECELCSHNDWVVTERITDNYWPVISVATFRGPDVFGGPYIETALMVCNHCGNVRQFARRFILEWKAEKARG